MQKLPPTLLSQTVSESLYLGYITTRASQLHCHEQLEDDDKVTCSLHPFYSLLSIVCKTLFAVHLQRVGITLLHASRKPVNLPIPCSQ